MRDSDLDRPEQHLDPEVLKRALHAVNNLVVITEPAGEGTTVVWVNDFFCSYTGYDREEVVGGPVDVLLSGDQEQAGLHTLREALSQGRYARVLLRHYRKDGGLFWNDLHVSPVPADTGGTAYFVWLMNDVSDLQEALASVVAREREVHETAENERERFGMDLHDGLGQTLTGLRMLAAVHHAKLQKDGPAHAAQAARLVALADQAALEARLIARGMNPVDASPEGLSDAIRSFTESLNLTLAGSGLHIDVDIEPVAFPDRRQALHLYRIVQEAVNNAVKHGGAGTISVTLTQEAREVTLEVCNEGGARALEPLEGSHRGMGHHGMRYRAGLIGAAYEADPIERGGTCVRVVLPLDA
ncbi:MAG TPA: PAS domain-containing protein, partial [Rhodothermales bacterium]|nr:PAS domain-containing protein [Rhodothermales bacterium]